MTEPEVLLWHLLKDRSDGLVFKRQKPYGPYILDFYCFAAGLVVEVDGAAHNTKAAKDAARDAYLAQAGLHIYRVASDVYHDAEDVADGIWLLPEELAAKRKQESLAGPRPSRSGGTSYHCPKVNINGCPLHDSHCFFMRSTSP